MTASAEAGRDRGTVPRVVSTIVCAYSREELPVAWLQVFHRFERAVEQSGLSIRVRLLPLEELPEAFEVLVVAPELVERATALGMGARVVAVTRPKARETAEGLLAELRAGSGPLEAEVRQADAPRIVGRRGSEEL